MGVWVSACTSPHKLHVQGKFGFQGAWGLGSRAYGLRLAYGLRRQNKRQRLHAEGDGAPCPRPWVRYPRSLCVCVGVCVRGLLTSGFVVSFTYHAQVVSTLKPQTRNPKRESLNLETQLYTPTLRKTLSCSKPMRAHAHLQNRASFLPTI